MNKKRNCENLESKAAAPSEDAKVQLENKRFHLVQLIISLTGFVLAVIALVKNN